MKRYFLTVGFSFLILNLLLAQSDIEKQIKDEIWTNCPKEFKVTSIPDKWKNESAVIIALRKEYSIAKNYEEKFSIHFRIKLLDKAAVEDYSEISFNDNSVKKQRGKAKAYNIMGIKVIKPSGTSKEVSLSEAVKTDAGSDKDLKIPIPNLETGDIIDYFIALKVQNYTQPGLADEEILERKYPVMSSVSTYKLYRDFILHGLSYNGAPEFKKEQQVKEVIYTLKDEMREKAPDIMWEYSFRTSPQVRFYINSIEPETDFKDKANDVLSNFNYNLKLTNTSFIEDYMKENFKKEKDPKKIVDEIYYLLRNPIYRQVYFDDEQGQPLKSSYTPDKFFYLVGQYLASHKISYEFVVAPARGIGPFSQLVNLSSCDLMIKVNTTPAIYIPRPSPFAIPGEIPYYFEGVNAVSRSIIPKESSYNDKKLDSTSIKENYTSSTYNVSINSGDKTKVDIKRSVSVAGHPKDYHQYLVFTNYDYLKEYDQPKYQVERSHLFRKLINDYNKEKEKFEQRMTQDYHERDEKVKDKLEKELVVKISDFKNLKVKSIGMWSTSPNVEYSDEFSIDNLTKKAGPNIIIELGKLIEEQVTVKEKERQRTRDIYMEYARAFNNEINFTIPEGYTIEGLENFNKKIENSTGGFISSAKITGNTLSIKTKKFYSANYYKTKDWPKIVEFLDAAVACYNAKILLKKGNSTNQIN